MMSSNDYDLEDGSEQDNDEDDDFFQFKDTMIEGEAETRNEDFFYITKNDTSFNHM